MTRCICNACGREVNGRVPANGTHVTPYRHFPPSELGFGSYRHDDGTTSWFGGGRWCSGGYEPARKVL